MNFLSRQRRAVKYSHKYIITAEDTKRAAAISEKSQKSSNKDPNLYFAKLLEGFDPMNN